LIIAGLKGDALVAADAATGRDAWLGVRLPLAVFSRQWSVLRQTGIRRVGSWCSFRPAFHRLITIGM
jgi:hypothetical protein